jgi:gliding motility-associated-like protein
LKIFFFSILFTFGFVAKAQLNDIMITEFVDWDPGSGFIVKVYNPTSQTIDLSNYYFHYFTNGNAVFQSSVQLSGTIATNQTVIIANNHTGTMGCNYDIVLTTITAGTNENDGVAITFGPAASNVQNSTFVDMINCFGTDVAPKINGTTRALLHKKIVRDSDNCIRYTSIDGTSFNSWPSSNSVNVQGWTVGPVMCLNASNTFNPFNVQNTVNLSFCQGGSVLINGKVITAAGIYRDTLPSFNKCDSILVYNVSVDNLKQKSANANICEGDSIFLEGMFRKVSGAYKDTIEVTNGCDTLLTTQLNVLPIARTSETINKCDGQSVVVNGQTYSADAVIIDTLQTSRGCDSIHVSTIKFSSSIVINENYTLCEGESVILNGNNYTSDADFKYVKSSATGCDTTVNVMVHVVRIDATFKWQSSIGDFRMVSFQANDLSGVNYLWDFGDSTSSTDINPTHTFLPGRYTVTLKLIGENGCEFESTQLVEVLETTNDLFVPNVFTPNGDYVNDCFELTFAAPFELHVSIFNRWGQLIYESNDCYFKWNGEYKGEAVQTGTYVYIITGKFNRKGTLTLLR